jgi:hypothetical protein
MDANSDGFSSRSYAGASLFIALSDLSQAEGGYDRSAAPEVPRFFPKFSEELARYLSRQYVSN